METGTSTIQELQLAKNLTITASMEERNPLAWEFTTQLGTCWLMKPCSRDSTYHLDLKENASLFRVTVTWDTGLPSSSARKELS